MKTVIVDDEKRSRISLELLLKNIKPDIEIIGQAENVRSGIALLKTVKPDLVFLDINMSDGDAFDLLEQIKPYHFNLVFVTAYDKFALKAFEYSVVDYLVKPIDHDLLIRVFNKLSSISSTYPSSNQIDLLKDSVKTRTLDQLIIYSEKKHVCLSVSEILRIEADGNYSVVWLTTGKRHVSSKGLKHYEELLDNRFYRIHHSHLVNLTGIKQITNYPDFTVILVNDKKLPVSVRRKKKLMELIEKRFKR